MIRRTLYRLKQRVAVFGGAMDPPTAGHMLCVGELLNKNHVSKVLVVPCGDREDKPGMSNFEHRIEMTKLSVSGYFGNTDSVVVVDAERDQPIGFATYDLMKLLSKKYEDYDLTFVVGADWLEHCSSILDWPSLEGKTGMKLVSQFSFTVVPRPGYNHPEFLPVPSDRFEIVSDLIGVPLSSTFIRDSVRSNKSIHGLVHPSVSEYISAHKLYASGSC
eukprot:TRINITY_DN37826_c0_g1_i1.p1 TRINITY_DN37826_c0_g1~~TRINITY_DN37826_c0_g1_i1.p1  ORF type:complete len:218 (+),score=35.21 TRINITY_DN37826_c0_g1_i1:62-715(+)